MNLNIVSGKGAKEKTTKVSLSASATCGDLKAAYAALSKKSIHRLSFKKDVAGSSKPIRLDNDKKSLTSYGVVDNDTLTFKDLGPQIGYRTVFVVEYLGPILIMLLYAMRPSLIFGEGASSKPYDPVAKLGLICWMIHFCKREFETFFVHKFSRYVVYEFQHKIMNVYKCGCYSSNNVGIVLMYLGICQFTFMLIIFKRIDLQCLYKICSRIARIIGHLVLLLEFLYAPPIT